MDEELRSEFHRLAREHGISRAAQLNHSMYGVVEWIGDRSRANLTRDRKREEKPHAEEFIETGSCGSLSIMLGETGAVQLLGREIQGSRVLFEFGDETIVAGLQRSKHLKKLLEHLAEREGWNLVFVEAALAARNGVNVAFWDFKRLKEVDDTALVTATRPQVERRSRDVNVLTELQRRVSQATDPSTIARPIRVDELRGQNYSEQINAYMQQWYS